ncbi:Uncharacterised protein [Bordetella pertussis]|nr:Uncharacterised protein [Bordetella pertussis]
MTASLPTCCSLPAANARSAARSAVDCVKST